MNIDKTEMSCDFVVTTGQRQITEERETGEHNRKMN